MSLSPDGLRGVQRHRPSASAVDAYAVESKQRDDSGRIRPKPVTDEYAPLLRRNVDSVGAALRSFDAATAVQRHQRSEQLLSGLLAGSVVFIPNPKMLTIVLRSPEVAELRRRHAGDLEAKFSQLRRRDASVEAAIVGLLWMPFTMEPGQMEIVRRPTRP